MLRVVRVRVATVAMVAMVAMVATVAMIATVATVARWQSRTRWQLLPLPLTRAAQGGYLLHSARRQFLVKGELRRQRPTLSPRSKSSEGAHRTALQVRSACSGGLQGRFYTWGSKEAVGCQGKGGALAGPGSYLYVFACSACSGAERSEIQIVSTSQ